MAVELDNVAAFYKVAELGSFTKAAEALAISAPVISKRVSALEGRLGTQLFVRTTRRVHLTEEGRDFYSDLEPVYSKVERAVDSVLKRKGMVVGECRVILPTYFVTPELYDHVIPQFAQSHPDCQLQIKVVSDPLAFLTQPVDLIVTGRLPDARLPDTQLGQKTLVELRGAVYGSPEYFEAHGHPKHPMELLEHRCLHYLTRRWRFKAVGEEPISVEPPGQISTNSHAVLRAMALKGSGLVYTLPGFFDNEIREGLVVPTLERYTADSKMHIHLLYQRNTKMPERTVAFMRALESHFGSWS